MRAPSAGAHARGAGAHRLRSPRPPHHRAADAGACVRAPRAGTGGDVFVAERVREPAWDDAAQMGHGASPRRGVRRRRRPACRSSDDGRKLLIRAGGAGRAGASSTRRRRRSRATDELDVSLRTEIDPPAEWKQIFDEAWRIERDFFYAPNHHGADWNAVKTRYEPLVPYVRHRTDLTYITDMVGGELSVAHSFVREGDVPAVDSSRIGALGADLVAENGHWRIARIFTSESWNPGLVRAARSAGDEGARRRLPPRRERRADVDERRAVEGARRHRREADGACS